MNSQGEEPEALKEVREWKKKVTQETRKLQTKDVLKYFNRNIKGSSIAKRTK